MKKAIAIVLAALVGGGAVAGIAYKSKGFRDWSRDTWLNNKSEATATDEPDPDETTDETEKDDVKLVMRKLAAHEYEDYGVSAQSDSAYTVTATVAPSDATDPRLSWKLQWRNASSSWASGKSVTSYLHLSTDGNRATVSCSAPFGESAELVCSVANVSDISATCALEYCARIEPSGNGQTDIDLVQGYGNGSTQTLSSITSGASTLIVAKPEYTAGTKYGELSYGKLYITPSQGLIDYVRSRFSAYVSANGGGDTSSIGSIYDRLFTRAVCDFDGATTVTIPPLSTYYWAIGSSWETLIEEWFRDGIRAGKGFEIVCSYTYTYGGATLSSGDIYKAVSYTVGTVNTASVTLDNSVIVF